MSSHLTFQFKPLHNFLITCLELRYDSLFCMVGAEAFFCLVWRTLLFDLFLLQKSVDLRQLSGTTSSTYLT